MLLDTVYKKISAVALACLIVSPAVGQEEAGVDQQDVKENVKPAAEATASATLSADGQFSGRVMTANGEETTNVPNATISLVSAGKVIDSVVSDASGQYSFQDVHPGPYEVVGTAPGHVGSQTFQVGPHVQSQPSTRGHFFLEQTSPDVIYESYSSAPAASFSSAPTVSYAGGGGSAIGNRLGGRLGRGFLRSPRGLLVVGGIVGGVAAAIDSSPDN